VDAKRQRLESRIERQPVPGAALELTLDLQLQYIAERELKAGVEAHRARGGTAIIMAPATGEILALANYPTFNPNAVSRSDDDDRRNRVTQDVYEPGSTFKIVTASAALEEGMKMLPKLTPCSDPYETARGADALVLLTEWNEFRNLDLKKLKSSLREPRFIDLRNVYEPERMVAAGFHYHSIGRPDRRPPS
jgi:cell division protein FtsI/penicillin-binding protein 2